MTKETKKAIPVLSFITSVTTIEVYVEKGHIKSQSLYSFQLYDQYRRPGSLQVLKIIV